MGPGLSAEKAAKVLNNDLVNIVTKVAAGDTLSTSEREMMADFLAAQAEPADLLKARRFSLLRRWSQGARLNAEERTEIEGLIPTGALEEPEIAQPPEVPAPPTFTLEPPAAPPVPAPRAAPQSAADDLQPFAAYDEVYGIKPNRGRTISRWVDRGKKASPPDLPPLDDPPAMAGWWQRHMTWRVPDIMVRYAAMRAEHEAAIKDSETASPPSSAPASTTEAPLDHNDNSYQATLRRVHAALGSAWRVKEEADRSRDPAKIELADRQLDRALTRYREFERDAEAILGRDERTWKQIEEHYQEILEVVNRSVRSVMVRVATKTGLPPEWFRPCETAYQTELDGIMTALADNDYSTAVEPRENLTLEAA